jgi:uncharacterized membrane protein YkvA (DUF1232 family)
MKDKKNTIGFFHRIFYLMKALFDKRTPWIPKVIGIIIISYIVLPFDFVPDVIPVLGWLDDATLAALGIFIISLLIPKEVLNDYENPKNPPDKLKP